MGCVYCATNTVNGKKYVGKTIHNLDFRIKNHIYQASHNHSSRSLIHKAMDKYGVDVFSWEVLFKDNDEEILFQKEISYIQSLSTLVPNGYNIDNGGRGRSGYKASEATRLKMSQANLGKTKSPEWRDKISISNLGKHNDSVAVKRGWLTRRQRDKESGRILGVCRSSSVKKPWMAHIYYDGIDHYLGLFQNVVDAASAYNKRVIEIFGNDAITNDIGGITE
jgi:group I intron endonuclease